MEKKGVIKTRRLLRHTSRDDFDTDDGVEEDILLENM
jgi:hypothetical protein